MSSSIDSRIVTMKFDNSAFQRGATTTMSTLQKLSTALTGMPGAAKGLDAIKNSASRFSMGNMADQVTNVSAKFVALSTVAITALSNITNKAIDAGLQMVKSFTIAPITAGFDNYETKINAVQTILSNTAAQGTKLPQVTAALNQLNTYANKTVYNFSEMARNIGTFTAAGVDLKTSVSSIKGIANLAAMSGSTSEQASSAMYQLSQAIAAGQVHLQDWNSVVNAGIGGHVFQQSLVQTAQAMGTLSKNAVQTTGPMHQLTVNGLAFRNSLTPQPGQKSWLTSEVLTTALGTFTGDMTKAQLVAKGFTADQAKAIMAQAKTAQNAATQVKTLTQLMQALREEVASAWANVFQTLFGNINQAKALFSPLHQFLENMFTGPVKSLNKLLEGWAKLGGRTTLIDAITTAFKDLMRILDPVKRAFETIFPPETAKGLYDLTKKFDDFMHSLSINKHTMHDIRTIFEGLFSILKVGIDIIGNVAHYFFALVPLVGHGTGGLLDFVAAIAKVITKFQEWLSQGDYIGKFFDHIIAAREKVFGPIFTLLGKLLTLLGHLLVEGFNKLSEWFKEATPYVENFKNRMLELKTQALDKMHEAFDKLKPVLDWLKQLGDRIKDLAGTGALAALGGIEWAFSHLSDILPKIAGFVADIGQKIKDAFSHIDLGSIFGGASAGVGSGLNQVSKSIGGTTSVADKVSAAWQKVADAFKSVGNFLAPVGHWIMKIFGDIKDKIVNFFSGMGIEDALALVNTGFFIAFYRMASKFMGSLNGVATSSKETIENIGKVFEQVTSNMKTMQKEVKAAIILTIASALGILAASIWVLSRISPGDLAKSIGAMTAMLTALIVSLKVLTKGGGEGARGAGELAVVSAALTGIAAAVLVLAGAMAILGRMKLTDLAKGLGAVGLMLGGLTMVTKLMNAKSAASLLLAAGAMVVTAGAMTMLAGAIELYGHMSWNRLTDGLAKMAVTLVTVGLSMSVLGAASEEIILGAAALLITSYALIPLAAALKIMGSMSWSAIGKSLTELLGSMTILAAAMFAMTFGIAGAPALLIMVAALTVLIPVLEAFGHMSWDTIKHGLEVLGVVLGALGVAMLVLTPAIPSMLLFAIALDALGAGALLAGAGMALFATGLATLAVSGAAGFAVLTAGVVGLAELFPLLMQQIGLGIIAFAKVLQKAGPDLIKAFAVVERSLLDSITKNAPHFANALIAMIHAGLKVVRQTFPDWLQTGIDLLVDFLKGLDKNLPNIVNKADKLITDFLVQLGKHSQDMTNAAFKLIGQFLDSLTNSINKNHDMLAQKGGNLAWAIANGMLSAFGNAAQWIWDKVSGIAQGALDAASHVWKIASPSKAFHELGMYAMQGMSNGLDDHSNLVHKSAENAANNALEAVKTTMAKMGDAVNTHVNSNPVITPVLDLTQLQDGASKIGGVLGKHSVTASASLDKAAAISVDTKAASAGHHTKGGDTNIEFKQYNTSPKALTAGEIYRQTKSQISWAKEALTP